MKISNSIFCKQVLPLFSYGHNDTAKTSPCVPANFVRAQKGREIKTFLKALEIEMQKNKWLDTAEIYKMALKIIAGKNVFSRPGCLLIPEQMEFAFLEHQFIDKLSENRRIILQEEPVYNFCRPSRFAFISKDKTAGSSPLSYLYQVEQAPAFPMNIEIQQSYGVSNEVKGAFRRVKRDSMPLAQVLISYTSDTYVALIYSISLSLNIPLTFAAGIPLEFSHPGKLLFCLLNWIEDNYAVSHLIRALIGGIMKTPTPHILARLLRKTGIANSSTTTYW